MLYNDSESKSHCNLIIRSQTPCIYASEYCMFKILSSKIIIVIIVIKLQLQRLVM